MTQLTCHDCGEPLAEGTEVWREPATGRPDEATGEPYCPACADPIGIAA